MRYLAQLSGFVLALSCCAIAQGPAADPFAGTLSGDQLRVELRPAPDGNYTGTILLGQQSYPLTARRIGSTGLQGSFTSDGAKFAFTLVNEQGEFILATDGSEYRLQKAGPRPAQANPLSNRIPHTAGATPGPAGQAAGAGSVHRHDGGLVVSLPAGWTVENNPEGYILLPPGVKFDRTSADNPEIHVAGMQNPVGPEEEQQSVEQLSSAFLQAGVQMTRSGQRAAFSQGGRTGTVYSWEYRVPGKPAEYALRIFLSSGGPKAFVLLAAGEAPRIRAREQELRSVFVGANYEPPRMPTGGPLADDTQAAQMWLQKLRGKKVRQFITSAGMAGEKNHFLAADGSYSMSGSSLLSATVGSFDTPSASASGISRESRAGRWKVRDMGGQIYLQVWSTEGQVLMLPITTDERNWYLDGLKAFAVDP